MFWIGCGALLIIFFSFRAYINNRKKFRMKITGDQSSRLYFYLLQGGNLLLIISGLLFLMLAIVSHVNGFEVIFSSDVAYHIKINGS
ncbi:hypothetical protein [Fodinibius sp. Rm-B-1B1-1]|uniref:hypothetical protein n=1 Tax=Fodinibius alkaliphilus TaxID=3140241 RepID=UPI003159DC48